MDGITDGKMSGTFDRVVVLNLARRPDRLERFRTRFVDWPFKIPQRQEAVDGQAVGVPEGWDKGPGAWGCLLSHRQILEQAIADGLQSVLVLEDDAYPADNFSALARKFFADVPGDWDGLMLGAEHLWEPQRISPGVVRCVGSNRTHAYAVRGRFMKVLAQWWGNTKNDHCDIVLAGLLPHFRIYAPDPLLIGQDCDVSDVSGQRERLRFLSPEEKVRIAARDSRYRLERLVGKYIPRINDRVVTPTVKREPEPVSGSI